MNKNYFLRIISFLWWLLLLGACAEGSKPTIPSTQPIIEPIVTRPVITWSPVPTQMPTIAFLPTQTVLVPSPTPTQEKSQIMSPQVNQKCFEPKASLADLGIQNELFLVQTYDAMGNVQMENRSAMVVQPARLEPEPVPGTAPRTGWMLFSYKATPDGQWIDLRYVTQKKDRAEEMLKSWGGRLYRLLYSDDFTHFGYKFLYRDNLLIKADETNNNYRPVSLKDFDTQMEIELPGFPEDAYWGNIDVIWEESKDVYNFIYWLGSRGDDRLFMYNGFDHTSVPVFSWISEPAGWLTATLYQDADGKIGIYAFRHYGLDLAIGLDTQTILESKSYDDVMKKIRLPGDEMKSYDELVIQRLNGKLLLVKKTAENDDIFAVYNLDLSDLSLEDYCISSQADTITISVSFDEHYAAINFFRLEPPGFHLKEVVVLDLESGERAHIPDADFEIVGWLQGK
jgi:hypothetical protein